MSSIISQMSSTRQIDGCLTPTSDSAAAVSGAAKSVSVAGAKSAASPQSQSQSPAPKSAGEAPEKFGREINISSRKEGSSQGYEMAAPIPTSTISVSSSLRSAMVQQKPSQLRTLGANSAVMGSSSSSSCSNSASTSPMDTIPSPPMSPHTRLDELGPAASAAATSKAVELLFQKPTPAEMAASLERYEVQSRDSSERETQAEIPSIAKSGNSDHEEVSVVGAFPTLNLVAAPLYINPFHDLKTAGYKKRQFSFLAQYKLTQDKPVISRQARSSSASASSHLSSATSSPRRSPKSYNTVSRSRFEPSTTERPRTRRHVRVSSVSSVDESDSSASSAGATIGSTAAAVAVSAATATATASSSPAEPAKKRRRRKPTTRKANSATTRYDYDYTKLADFCPSTASLPDNARALKTEWKGQTMDLSDDPLAAELHPAELQLASTLRLPCTVYLDSKRRIFAEKVHRMKQRLPFRRTDAQKACKIDVNKASRLYASFERVGWLDESNFRKYL